LLTNRAGCGGSVHGSQIVGLRRLALGATFLNVCLIARRNSKRQRDAYGCENGKSRYFFGQKPS
jgi:hypothetical protein